MKRRDFLKGATLLAAGGALVGPMGFAAERSRRSGKKEKIK